MRKEIADLVFPVFRKSIESKEMLATDADALDFLDGQKKLFTLLQAPVPEGLRQDVIGDTRSSDIAVSSTRGWFLGLRYALACWLDEIFISDSTWQNKWNDSKMETTLYGMNERASEFWTQAQRAHDRPTRDALEVYYLCAMLGFRGEMIDRPEELNAWRESVESQITGGEGREISVPPGLPVIPNVPKLKGAADMQKWVMVTTVIALMLIPLLIVLVLN
ncbi:MAG: hypothetical protein EXS16_14320 [Gemmataceae bacterium]|nr:hypothetical protein [Gemmataceae bacterium]